MYAIDRIGTLTRMRIAKIDDRTVAEVVVSFVETNQPSFTSSALYTILLLKLALAIGSMITQEVNALFCSSPLSRIAIQRFCRHYDRVG